jgi:hypothetical protein
VMPMVAPTPVAPMMPTPVAPMMPTPMAPVCVLDVGVEDRLFG